METRKLSDAISQDIRQINRKSEKRFSRSKRLDYLIPIPFISPSFILDLSKTESLKEFQTQCNKLFSISSNDHEFMIIISSLVYLMNSEQYIRKGINLFVNIIPKMSQSQNNILNSAITERILEEWIDSAADSVLELLFYLCNQNKQWIRRIDKHIISKFIIFVVKDEANISSSYLLNLLLNLIQCQQFVQQNISDLDIIISSWLDDQPQKAFTLLKCIVQKHYCHTINTLQIKLNLYKRLNGQLKLDNKFRMKYLLLLNFEYQEFNWVQNHLFQNIVEIVQQLDLQNSFQEQLEEERIKFYELIDKLIKHYKKQSIRNRLNNYLFIGIKEKAICYQQKLGTSEGLRQAENIEDIY